MTPPSTQIKSSRIYDIVFSLGRSSTVQLTEDGLIYRKHFKRLVVSYADIVALPQIRSWYVVRTLRIPTKEGEVTVAGLRDRENLLRFCYVLKVRMRAARVEPMLRFCERVDAALYDYYAPVALERRYLKASMALRWQQRHKETLDGLEALRKEAQFTHLPTASQRRVARLEELAKEPDRCRKAANADFIEYAESAYKEFFDTIETKPLTAKQRRACVVDEDRNLVLAGAGSGKTSVIVGKAGFIEKMGWAQADEILVLAFGKKASRETQERIWKRLGEDSLIEAKTFHSLGLEVIGRATGKKPGLFAMLENGEKYGLFISSIREELTRSDAGYRDALVEYFSDYLYPVEEPEQFETLGAYYEHMKQHQPKALNGTEVKSLQELRIANFLYKNQVPFRYEPSYVADLATAEFRQYTPDFLIPPKLYIEHYGINERGETPPFMNAVESRKYKDAILWKREVHRTHNTGLIETYSWEFKREVVFDRLSAALASSGMILNPMDSSKLLDEINEAETQGRFDKLVAGFLELQKMNALSLEELKQLARADPETNRWLKSCGFGANALERFGAFMRLYEPIYLAYEKRIQEEGAVDFSDMINTAIGHIEEGRFKSPWKYILVDEFQDISKGRAKLIETLLRSREDATLFCVGDDWQSIYRFAGSDSRYVRDFEGKFGQSARTDLDMTFRFNSSITAVATTFISKNPYQLEKKIKSYVEVEDKRVTLIVSERNRFDESFFHALDRIDKEAQESGRASVFILGRFKFLKPENLGEIKERYPRLDLSYHTMHASKGTEADYVVVIGLNRGRYGMPSEIQSDPIIELLLPQDEAYENAEERRLLYVAITRSRKHTYLIADFDHPSPFAMELLKEQESFGIEAIDCEGNEVPASGIVHCDGCQSGIMLRRARRSDGSIFFGCSNFPFCKESLPLCPSCRKAPMQLSKGKWQCNHCSHAEAPCPACKNGVLTIREGYQGAFWGCSNYRGKTQSNSCTFTRQCTMEEMEEYKARAKDH